MPPRAGPSRARPNRGRPSFIPPTQFQGGPSSSGTRSEREESEDPLALSPIKVTPTITRARRSTRSSNVRSSSPASAFGGLPSSTQRVTRGSKRRDKELEELGLGEEDLVPPSEDGEYEEWKESRRARLEKGEGKEVDEEIDVGMRREAVDEGAGKGLRRPKKPDKRLTHERTFESLLPSPSPPSPTPSIASSVTDTRSRETSPTQPLSFSQQEDPFYTVFEGDKHMSQGSMVDEDIDELDSLGQGSESNRAAKVDEVNTDHQHSRSPDRSRTTTPHTIPFLPLREEAFETLLPHHEEDIGFGFSAPQEDKTSSTTPGKSVVQHSRSPTPQTIPFLPIQDQDFETIAPEIQIEHEDFAMSPHRPPTPTSANVISHSMLSPIPAPAPASSPSPSPSPFTNGSPITKAAMMNEILVSPSKQLTPPRRSSPARSLSPIFAAVAEHPVIHPPSSITGPPAPTPPPADPALAQFRGARTFRTRTVLQLQPYTKERQIYEAALKKGGLKKGKKAIAPSKEVTQEEVEEDEARVSESSEASAEDESPERIVIGNTPPPRKPREPKKLVDADFDEYFFEHGTAADESDPDHMKDLQKIARRRIKAAKEDRKRHREAEKERREFQRLMKNMRGDKEQLDEEESNKSAQVGSKSRVSVPRPASRNPRGLKTYVNKGRAHRLATESSSESEGDAQPPVRLPLSPTKSQNNTPTASFRTAFSDFNDVDMDVGYGQPQEPLYTELDTSANHSPLKRQTSFLIDDLPHSPTNTRPSFGSESDSASSSASTVQDRRQRIARRMMPAAMLRRLEAEAAAKERRKAENRKKQQTSLVSPIRPGRAVVRRGGGHGGIDDLDGLFDDEDPDIILQQTPPASFNHPLINSSDQPIVISDGGSSSEAEEDNQPEQTLARLHRGDFESIVSGNRWKSAAKPKPQNHLRHRHGPKQPRRPALGLAKRVRAPISESNRAMVQSRLDFPLKDRSPVSSVKKKRKRPFCQGKQQRPAIRLDDHVIFATTDFEFDEEEDDTTTRPAAKQKKETIPRHFARTNSANLRQPKSFDADMGKARSWANFDMFPIDFDITPLPSGVHCRPNSIPGSGQLEKLVQDIRGNKNDEIIDTCLDYGIELTHSMPPDAIQAVIPLVFDAVHRRMVVIANEDNAEGLDLECFRFLGRYVQYHQYQSDDTTILLKSDVENATNQLEGKLESLDIGRGKQGREALLSLRWALVELSCRLDMEGSMMKEEGTSTVRLSAFKLFHQLLSHGFDKTIRPLKQIMRGESDSAEIQDITITLWISLIHTLSAWDERNSQSSDNTFLACLTQAFDTVFHLDQTGPIAAERVWFLVFGLCTLTQFGADGKISSIFVTCPRWSLVRRAVGLIKVAFDEEAEKRAHIDQLQGRDRYIKVVMARCVRLSAVWKWSFDRESFSVATRNLGIIFKDRQYRNLPTEPPVDYPDFITRFDMLLTAAEDTKRETAFELYLRLVCVAASDIISAAQTLSEAQQAEKDVQRLVMSIIPVSSVKFNRIFPPSPKDLGQLINRYSTMIAGCYFSPSLLTYLLANSKKWSSFEAADFDSRQICIRGLMYLAVARRHHNQPLQPVVNRLAELMGTLQNELEILLGPSNQTLGVGPTKLEIERTMVLVVSCLRQMIKHHSFDLEEQKKAVYPDPCLLHESWTVHIFDLELAKDLKCGLEVIATIQSFLDTRASALPRLAKQRREAKESHSESLDEFGSLGIDFTDADVLALGGELGEADNEVEEQDEEFARIIEEVISPKIYRLLSDMLPPVPDEDTRKEHDADRQIFTSKLTKCWSDCASVLVVEHQKLDWSTFISPFGRQSWARLGDERGRVQVGLHFMLNVAQLDPGALTHHEEDFIALLFQVIGTDRLTVEHKYLSALLAMPGASDHLLLAPLGSIEALEGELSRDGFMGIREEALRAIFTALPDLLRSSRTPASTKSFIYRCINLFVSSLISYESSINPTKVIHKESYRAFTDTIIRDLRSIAGDYINPMSVPGLKHFNV